VDHPTHMISSLLACSIEIITTLSTASPLTPSSSALPAAPVLVAAYPSEPLAFDTLAHVQRKAGRLEAALDNYQRVVELDPDAEGIRAIIGELEAELSDD
ncbi:MAG: tetratricopeptide repeat protein, partial [Planctomycetota bacterium]